MTPVIAALSLPEPTSARVPTAATWSLLLVSVALLAGCGQGPSDLEQARDANDIGDRVRAIGYYQRHLQTAPDDFDARMEYTLLLGEAWAYGGGDRGPILENLEILHSGQPGNPRVKELFAMMLVREGQAAQQARRFEDAEADFLRAIDVHPDVGTPHYHLGVLYAEWGRPRAEFESLVAAALKRPPIPDLYLRLGLAYLDQGELDRAINTLELVAELRGTSTYLLPRMHCGLAKAFRQRGDDDAAREHLDQAPEDCSFDGPDL